MDHDFIRCSEGTKRGVVDLGPCTSVTLIVNGKSATFDVDPDAMWLDWRWSTVGETVHVAPVFKYKDGRTRVGEAKMLT